MILSFRGDLMLTLGDKILYLRKRLKLTQTKLGMLIGNPEQTAKNRISQYEKNKRYPTDETIDALAKALGVSSAYLKSPTDATPEETMEFFYFLERYFNVRVDKDHQTNEMLLRFPTPEQSLPNKLIQLTKNAGGNFIESLSLEKEEKKLAHYKNIYNALDEWFKDYCLILTSEDNE